MTLNPTPRNTNNHTPKSAKTDYVPLYRFWQPRYWLLWIGIGVIRLMIMLPFRVQLWIGRGFGKLLFMFATKRRRIAEINLRICFPELDETELQKLVRAHGASLAFSAFEIGLALWGRHTRIEKLVTIEGLDNLTAQIEQGHGIIVLSGHFPAIELVGRAAIELISHTTGNGLLDSGAMYRPLKNPMVDQLLRRARKKAISQLIPKDGVRHMIRLLRNGTPFWYAADQSYDRINAELVPFFGEPAMTNASLTSIARVSKARVVPFFQRRLADGSGYKGVFLPALENFPTTDQVADAERVNTLLEEWIRKAPEQYYWVHRRFKNRPAPYPDPYQDI